MGCFSAKTVERCDFFNSSLRDDELIGASLAEFLIPTIGRVSGCCGSINEMSCTLGKCSSLQTSGKHTYSPIKINNAH